MKCHLYSLHRPLSLNPSPAGRRGSRGRGLDVTQSDTRRSDLDRHTQIEEISALLRLLETAAEKNVLVVATTTNRIESLDPALLRKGRFDYHLCVDYATTHGIHDVLTKELNKRRISQHLDLSVYISALQGRPLSDVAWLVNEAGRLTLRHQRNEIDSWSLDLALKHLV